MALRRDGTAPENGPQEAGRGHAVARIVFLPASGTMGDIMNRIRKKESNMKKIMRKVAGVVLTGFLFTAVIVGMTSCPNPAEPEPDGSGIAGTIVGKCLDRDGAAGDCFGRSVCVDGDYTIVGAYKDDDLGSNSGSVHIFEYDGSMWHKLIKLTAGDGAASDYFGYSVSLDGDYAIVGAYGVGSGTETGAAYVFARDDTGWMEQAKLTGSGGYTNQNFGRSVAIDGSYAIVGAENDDPSGSSSGSAYVFERNGATWTEKAPLIADDGDTADYFGCSVAIDGDYAIVGAWYDDDNDASGSAYIFVRDPIMGWKQQAKLLPNGAAINAGFGCSVAIRGDCAIIGDGYSDVDGKTDSGSAYVFVRSGTTWTQQIELTPSDGSSNQQFGISVSFNGDCAVVGASGDKGDSGFDFFTGAAYLFTRSGTIWTEQARLTAYDGVAEDYFGRSVSVSSDWVLVGAHYDDDKGDQSGSAYIFD